MVLILDKMLASLGYASLRAQPTVVGWGRFDSGRWCGWRVASPVGPVDYSRPSW
jgi:hypothetical protein